MTTLTVERDKGWTDKLRKYQILLDGVEIGRLGEGAKLLHQVGEGRHVIEAAVDWCGSQPLSFEANAQDLVVTVKSALRGWRVFFSLFYIIFNRRGYLTLELNR
jgi:myo-inositol catabolism protein IolC